MASKIQRAFLDTAAAPMRECADLIRSSRLRDALDAVSRPKLEGALRDGLAAVSASSGAQLGALEAAAPMDELRSAMGRIDTAHRGACDVLARFLTSTVSLAPASAEPLAAGAELRGLAARYALDRHIAGPLETLSAELDAWHSQLEALSQALAKDRSVVAAQRRRWVLRGAAALTAVVVVASVIAFLAWSRLVVRASQDRVATALASPDPCAWETVAGKDLAHATPSQRLDYDAKKPQCEALRAKEAHEAACAALADHVDAGAWAEPDSAAAGPSSALLRRTAARTLEAADLLVDDKAMPCQDSRVARRLWDAFTKAAAGSTGLWGSAERISPHVATLLRRPGFALAADADEALLEFGDGLARRAIKTGQPDELARASLVCKLRPSLGLPQGRACAALDRIMSR